MTDYVPLRVNSESCISISRSGMTIEGHENQVSRSRDNFFSKGSGRSKIQSTEEVGKEKEFLYANKDKNICNNNSNIMNSALMIENDHSKDTNGIKNSFSISQRTACNRYIYDENDSPPIVEIFEEYSLKKLNKDKDKINTWISHSITPKNNTYNEKDLYKKYNLSDFISDNQSKIFAFFATLNPQNLLKDEKFKYIKHIISNKYNDDRIKNLLCMYLLYSEKELENINLNTIKNSKNVVKNSSFNSLKIHYDHTIGTITNTKEKSFVDKHFEIIHKVTDININMEPKIMCNNPEESQIINEKISKDSDLPLNKKTDSTLPVNIFNNFSQNGMTEFPNNNRYPLNFELAHPTKAPVNLNQSQLIYNPIYAANPMLYCLSPVIPSSHLINYMNTQSLDESNKLFNINDNINEFSFSGNKDKVNNNSENKKNEKKGKTVLKKKRLRQAKKNMMIGNVDPYADDDITYDKQTLQTVTNNPDDFEIPIQSNCEINDKNKELSIDPFEEVSREMDKIERTPSFRANEDISFINENSFRIDHFLDFNNYYSDFNMEEDRKTIDIDSHHLDNCVLNFNKSIENGFEEKFCNSNNIDISDSYSVSNSKEIKNRNIPTDRIKKNTNRNYTLNNNHMSNIDPDKLISTIDNTNKCENINIHTSAIVTDRTNSLKHHNNKRIMSKSLLPSLLEPHNSIVGNEDIKNKCSKNTGINMINKSAKFSETEIKILNCIEDIHNRKQFEKLRTLIPEHSHKILDNVLFRHNHQFADQNEITVNLTSSLYLKIFPRTGKFSVVRSTLGRKITEKTN